MVNTNPSPSQNPSNWTTRQTPHSVDPLLKDLLPDYVVRRRQDLREIREALMTSSFDKIGQICHKIQGNATTFGFTGLQEICAELEACAHRQDVKGINALLARADDEKSWIK